MHILIVEARFYEEISDELAAGAIAELESGGATFERIAVPGALEIPQAVGIALAGRHYHGVVALGCVIRGETSHYDIVANESARALMEIALERQVPVGNGILTVDSRDQALERAGRDRRNKGAAAAAACLALCGIRAGFAARSDG